MILGDPAQPRSERFGRAQPGDLLPGLEKRRLRQVGGECRVPALTPEQREQPGLVVRDERLERGIVAGDREHDQPNVSVRHLPPLDYEDGKAI